MKTYLEDALESIDATLFSGDPSPEDLVVIEEYIARWLRRIPELKEHAKA